MPHKLLETKHDLGRRFSVVLILKKFLKGIHDQRESKLYEKKQYEKTVDCYRIQSISNYVILFEQTTKLNVLNYQW